MENLEGKAGIYIIENLINNKIYVGSSINLKRRKYFHFNYLRNNKHGNKHLQLSFNKYGERCFNFKIIEYTSVSKNMKSTKNILIKREQYYIDKLNATDITIGYNICKSAKSRLGVKSTQETKDKISKAHIGKKHSKQHRKNISVGNMGRSVKDMTRYKIRKGLIGNKNSLNKNTKQIINITTGEIFDSITIAEKHYNILHGHISDVCSGKRKSTHGYMWAYIVDNNIIYPNYVSKRKTRSVINIEANEVFDSMVLAARAYNITPSAIMQHLKKEGSTCKGYHWQYYEDYLKDQENSEAK